MHHDGPEDAVMTDKTAIISSKSVKKCPKNNNLAPFLIAKYSNCSIFAATLNKFDPY
jgi:hypothetical protein